MARRAVVLFALAALGCSSSGEQPAASKAAPAPAASSSPASGDDKKALRPAASVELPKRPPAVDLSGASRPEAVSVVKSGPRVYARALRAWVRERPQKSARRLGYLRAGASSPTSAEAAGNEGCRGGWYPVEPRGFVCVGREATLDGDDPIVRASEEHRPDHMRRLPYIYGTVRRVGPIYRRLPTGEQLRRAEPSIDERMDRWLAAGGEIGASYAQHVWMGGHGDAPDPAAMWAAKETRGVPPLLRGGAAAPILRLRPDVEPEAVVVGRTRRRVGYAFLETFLHEGRRYGLTVGLDVLPTDRLRPIQGSSFHGFQIGKEIELPFAIVRQPGAHFYVYQASTKRMLESEKAPYRSAIKLTGKQRIYKKRLYYQTVDKKWLVDREASRLDPAKRMPAWGKRGEKWIDVNLTKQTIVLYEGTRPVYATLISSGEAGLEDPKHTTATKRGIFRIHTKHVTATMSSDEVGEEFELRDVPYVQYFDKEGYALHGAYWHDRFGIPKSHGCLNLSPEDARRVFHWTDPQVPAGWHGAMLPLRGTVLFVHP